MSDSGIIFIVGVISARSVGASQDKSLFEDFYFIVILWINAALTALVVFNHIVFYCWKRTADTAFFLGDSPLAYSETK